MSLNVSFIQNKSSTQNATDSFLDLFFAENLFYIELVLYVLYSLIFLFGIIGNSIVIYVLMSSICINRILSPKQKSPQSINNNNLNQNNKFQQNNNSFKNLVKRTENKQKDLVTHFHNSSNNCDTSLYARNPDLKPNYKKSQQNNRPSLELNTSRFYSLVCKFLREKLTVTNFYLLNLAISDFLYLSFIPVLLCTILNGKWLFGTLFCKLYFSSAYLCQCSSVFVLVVLSVDRYLSVKYPLKTSTFRSDELARIVILISWLLTFLFISPVFLYTDVKESSCQIHWPEKWNFATQTYFSAIVNRYLSPLHLFNIYTFLLNYLIPVTIIVILYTQILNNLHQNSQRNSATKKSKQRRKSHRHVTKMVLTIIICYIVCWTPYWCYQVFIYVYSQIFMLASPSLFVLISHFVQIIAYLSSALNPFIYSYMSEAFRTNLNAVLTNCNCCFCMFKQTELKPDVAQKPCVKVVQPVKIELKPQTTTSSPLSINKLMVVADQQCCFIDEPEDINTIREEDVLVTYKGLTSSDNQQFEGEREAFLNADETEMDLKRTRPMLNMINGCKVNKNGSKIKKLVLLNTSSSKLKFEINFHGLKNFKLIKNIKSSASKTNCNHKISIDKDNFLA